MVTNTEQNFVVKSLELHVFSARIMKEHAIFMHAGFTPRNADLSRRADQFKLRFENVLNNASMMSSNVISHQAVSSGEIVTDYTLGCERKTQDFTGIAINSAITRIQANLYGNDDPVVTPDLARQVKTLNTGAMSLIDEFIEFKREVINSVLSCEIFTGIFPLELEHLLREAMMYRSNLTAIENNVDTLDVKGTQLFWDEIMHEHALFIRSQLDPVENVLISKADGFAVEYNNLMKKLKDASESMLSSITDQTLKTTLRFRDFKSDGTRGIAECKIRSVILPLLADHVLREANRYIRILKQHKS